MSKKLNCWEYFNCGREKGGLMVPILGECSVASEMKYDGMNDGQAAGRACWMVHKGSGCTASGCTGSRCYECQFYNRVLFEQEDTTVFKFASV